MCRNYPAAGLGGGGAWEGITLEENSEQILVNIAWNAGRAVASTELHAPAITADKGPFPLAFSLCQISIREPPCNAEFLTSRKATIRGRPPHASPLALITAHDPDVTTR